MQDILQNKQTHRQRRFTYAAIGKNKQKQKKLCVEQRFNVLARDEFLRMITNFLVAY